MAREGSWSVVGTPSEGVMDSPAIGLFGKSVRRPIVRIYSCFVFGLCVMSYAKCVNLSLEL